MMKPVLATFILFLNYSCLTMRMPPDAIHSPDGLFILFVYHDHPFRKTVGLILYDSSYHKLDSFDTRASVKSKWVVGWSAKDTIVFNSRDIGLHVLLVSGAGGFTKLPSTPRAKQFSDSLLKAKYRTD